MSKLNLSIKKFLRLKSSSRETDEHFEDFIKLGKLDREDLRPKSTRSLGKFLYTYIL